jgi:hypothetical protein
MGKELSAVCISHDLLATRFAHASLRSRFRLARQENRIRAAAAAAGATPAEIEAMAAAAAAAKAQQLEQEKLGVVSGPVNFPIVVKVRAEGKHVEIKGRWKGGFSC